ncbi:adenosylcobinamide-GDP ribazoletransferase [Aestuariivita boseongensis]|uniref:adenosylcobinamide-GDP ribazoletransferase n=1 Tax=Aestuariivita boseongensis TaxID=1470562 RepID=UPI000680DEF6|nr:adenosylcobinamide-GDP ribazoletransferase [Aestuariivita boseongensis]
MRENDTAPFRPLDLGVALALLTRLPLPALPKGAFDRQAQASWAFPLVGALLGLLAALVAFAAMDLGLPVWIAAGLVLAVQIILTGALHEDGLADCADGFWGGFAPERRLEIMKDSHIGTYGVLALVLSVGLRWSALSVVIAQAPLALVAVAVASRMGLPAMMSALPRARPGGLSDRVGEPPLPSVAASVLIGLVMIGLATGMTMAPIVLAALLAIALCGAVAQAKIGGQTGDVLGATQQVTEIACLLALAALWA